MTRFITHAQNEALAQLNAALYAASDTQLLTVLHNYMDPTVASLFYEGVGKLCVEAQPSEVSENAGATVEATDDSTVAVAEQNTPRLFEGVPGRTSNFQDLGAFSRFFTDNGEGYTKTGDTTCIDDYSQRPIQIAADAVVWVKTE